jgi:hypothetical protein
VSFDAQLQGAGGVLLNQRRRPHHRLQILVPSGYESGEAYIVGKCHVCGSEFGEGQEAAWQRHVGDCARKHMGEILANRPSERQKGGPFDPDNWDREVDDYMVNVVGKRMREEGRFEVRPSERAGFS